MSTANGHLKGIRGRISDRTLVALAWFEWRTNLILIHGLPPDVFEVRPPAWFRNEELGFAFDSGPSIRWTMSQLEKQHGHALKQLGPEAPYRLARAARKTKTRDPRLRREAKPAR